MAIDPEEFQIASTDEGKDVSEGEMGYRVEPNGDGWAVVEFLAGEYSGRGEIIAYARSRAEAETKLKKQLRFTHELQQCESDEERDEVLRRYVEEEMERP